MKLPTRTVEQQKYRDNLAKKINTMSKFGKLGRNLAENFLNKEKSTEKYQESIGAERFLLKLLNENKFDELDEFMEKLESRSLNSNVIMQLLENKFGGYYVVKYIDKFKDVYRVPSKLIDKGFSEVLAHDLGNFRSLSRSVAEKLLNKGYIRQVAKNLDSFLMGGLGKYEAKIILNEGYIKDVACHLRRFTRLDDEVAKILIENGYADKVAQELESFDGLSKETAEMLSECGEIFSVATNYYRFNGVDISWGVEKLLKENKGGYIAEHVTNFPFRDRSYVAKELTDKGYIKEVAENIDNFRGLDSDMAEILIDNGYAESVVSHMYVFTNGLSKNVAMKLIDNGYAEIVVKMIDKFELLDGDIAEKLKNAGYEDYVTKYPKKFGL